MKWFSRVLSVTAIAFADGRCEVLKGKLGRSVVSDLGDELAAAEVDRGEIWIGGDQRIRFSAEIPAEIHQRLRNILTRI